LGAWPISFDDVLEARRVVRAHLAPTALRPYAALDASIGRGIRVLVKHENHNPTTAFKVRNGLVALSRLTPDERKRGVVAASTGNHGQGLAWAGSRLGAPVTICVPIGNNPEKNAAMRDLGATLVEEGADYDASTIVAERLAREQDLTIVHSTNNAGVIAGAGTIALEILEERPDVEAIVVSIGGGSQAVGAITVARGLGRAVPVYGVQAERASAVFQSWRSGNRVRTPTANTFAEGLATRTAYDFTLDALREGLEGFVTVAEAEMAEALRLLLRVTHNLAEGAGAASLAGLFRLCDVLAGKTVAIVLSGGNIDIGKLRRVLGVGA
jgi:threonine dehydratase